MEASQEAVTYKTLVLVALALVAHQGKFIALPCDRQFASLVFLNTDSLFIPKSSRDRFLQNHRALAPGTVGLLPTPG